MMMLRKFTPLFLVFFGLMFAEAGITTDYADARSKFGGRSFSRPATRKAPSKSPAQVNKQNTGQQKSGFGRGLAGGLLGGAIGGMLFGSLFGAGGSGFGILPLLLLGGIGFFLYKRFMSRPSSSSSAGYQPPPFDKGAFSGQTQQQQPDFEVPPIQEDDSVEGGLSQIRMTDAGFDESYFLEIASDVFFKIQAGWMRRDLDSYRHLLGNQLASEYDTHFAEMKAKGQINKLESIAIRKVVIVDAGKQENEDFVTVLFTANLLDYTVDDKTGDVLEGSVSDPVKFAEKWTWARPVNTEEWKLEGIQVVEK